MVFVEFRTLSLGSRSEMQLSAKSASVQAYWIVKTMEACKYRMLVFEETFDAQ